MWTSSTGRRWRLSASFGGHSDAARQASTVAMLGPDAVAVGSAPVSTASGVDAAAGAQGWSQTIGGWTSQGALDGTVTPVADEEPLGSCSDGHLLVVVGQGTRRGVPRIDGESSAATTAPSPTEAPTTTVVATGSPAGPDGQGDDGTVALTWTTTDARSWTAGNVSPVSGAGGAETMLGCAALGTGFVAWGQATDRGGLAVPALWSSPDGIVWTLDKSPSLAVAGSAPLTSLVRAGRSWYAVSGGEAAAMADPAAYLNPAGLSAAASGPDGPAGVWSSDDGGASWVRLDTAGPLWATTGTLATDLVTAVGDRVVVAGSVNGRLGTWAARPGTTTGGS